MSQIEKKLKSKSGASMILALALFLICTMVSSVIIVAAANGTSRNKNRIEQQREYLAVSSATDFIVEELSTIAGEDGNPKTFVGNDETRKYGCQDCTIRDYTYENGYVLDVEYVEGNSRDTSHVIIVDGKHPDAMVHKTVDKTESTLYTDYEGVLGSVLMRLAEKIFTLEGVPSVTESFNITLDDTNNRLPEVKCVVTMDREYDVTVKITAADSPYGGYSIIVSAEGDVDDTTSMKTSEAVCYHIVHYKKYMETGEFIDAVYGSYELSYTNNIGVVEITWKAPEVEKGVFSE